MDLHFIFIFRLSLLCCEWNCIYQIEIIFDVHSPSAFSSLYSLFLLLLHSAPTWVLFHPSREPSMDSLPSQLHLVSLHSPILPGTHIFRLIWIMLYTLAIKDQIFAIPQLKLFIWSLFDCKIHIHHNLKQQFNMKTFQRREVILILHWLQPSEKRESKTSLRKKRQLVQSAITEGSVSFNSCDFWRFSLSIF